LLVLKIGSEHPEEAEYRYNRILKHGGEEGDAE